MTVNSMRILKALSFGLALTLFVFGAWLFQKNAPEIIELINNLGWLAPVLFVATYCLATILFLPTMVLTLAGGALFGPVFGTALNLFGATSGAAISFLITRHLVYDWFVTNRSERVEKLIAGVDQRGWLFVAILRLFPIIPFNLVNYGLGITGIRFRLYLLTTFVFLLPPEIIYTYFGYAGMTALSQSEHFYRTSGMVLTGLVILILCVIRMVKRKK